MRGHHDRQSPRTGQQQLPVWSAAYLPSWAWRASPRSLKHAGAVNTPRRQRLAQAVHNRWRRGPSQVTWTCAGCGESVDSLAAAARHIASAPSHGRPSRRVDGPLSDARMPAMTVVSSGGALPDRSETVMSGASVWLRLRVRLARRTLDDRIAAGSPCAPTAPLALRAAQLTHPSTRRRIAADLRGMVEYVDRVGSSRFVSPVRVDRDAVRVGRAPLLELAERLEGTDRVSPVGMVRARRLVRDHLNSPLYDRYSAGSVTDAVRAVIEEFAPAKAQIAGDRAAARARHDQTLRRYGVRSPIGAPTAVGATRNT
jgi:hypothetical protein